MAAAAEAPAPAAPPPKSPHVIADLDAFASSLRTLSRPARVKRLLFVSERSADATQARRAADLALKEARQGRDADGYRDAVAAVRANGGEPNADPGFAERVDGAAREELAKLEADLSRQRAAANKDQIWKCYRALGDFHVDRGELAPALKAFARMRDYAATGSRTLETCGRVAAAAASHGNWTHVTNYCAKADHAMDALGAASRHEGAARRLKRRLGGCKAALQLDGKKYGDAAKTLAELARDEATGDDGGFLSSARGERDHAGFDAVPPADAGPRAALLAAASLPRAALKKTVMDDAVIRGSLSPAARGLVEASYKGNYGDALGFLSTLVDELALDPVYAPHADSLKDAVTDRCVAQYCKPYGSVDLATMAEKFSLPLPDLEDRVARLVGDGELGDLRVDAQQKTLVSVPRDPRSQAVEEIIKQGDAYLREVRGLLLRASCLEHDLVARGRGGASSMDRGPAGLEAWAGGGAGARRLGRMDRFGGMGMGGMGGMLADVDVVDDDDDAAIAMSIADQVGGEDVQRAMFNAAAMDEGDDVIAP